MAYVKTVSLAEATGDLRQLYERILGGQGRGYGKPGEKRIPNIIGISSLRPHLIPSFFAHFANVMFADSGLSRAEREMIATVVSWANKCQY